MALEATHENNDCFAIQLVPHTARFTSNTFNPGCPLRGRPGAVLDRASHNSNRPKRFAGGVVLLRHSAGKPAGRGVEGAVGTRKRVRKNAEYGTNGSPGRIIWADDRRVRFRDADDSPRGGTRGCDERLRAFTVHPGRNPGATPWVRGKTQDGRSACCQRVDGDASRSLIRVHRGRY